MTDSLLVFILCFFCQLINTVIGMGFGTILTPLLLLADYQPLQVVPAILCADLVTGVLASGFHCKYRNVKISKSSPHFKLVVYFFLLSFIGVLIATFVSTHISTTFLKLWIGVIVLAAGLLSSFPNVMKRKKSWTLLYGLSTLASFNKGLSGGGYGPIIMSGQIINGIRAKTAVGITAFSEAATCTWGIILYRMSDFSNWDLVPIVTISSILAVPCGIYLLRFLPEKSIRPLISKSFIVIGILTIIKSLYFR